MTNATRATKVKICGVRRVEDARLAVDLGAWAVGFIFHRPSPRCIEPGEAAAIIEELPPEVLKVGVFVDRSLDEVQRAVEVAGLSAVQLHGDETPEYAASVCAGEVWKAFRVRPGFRVETVDAYRGCGRILLDTYSERAAGGTGETFDWSVAREVGRKRPVVLAGGLGPSNVAEALRVAAPECVDVSSGVESAPGVKDHGKLRELFEAVRRHDARGEGEAPAEPSRRRGKPRSR